MKKYFILATAALVALTACTKVDVPTTVENSKKISFQVANYVAQTKAEETVELTETKTFSSKAWLHANGDAAGTPFFGTADTWTETISRNPSTDASAYTWEPSLEYFWPKGTGSYINFISWYATGSKDPSVPDETHMNWGSSTSALEIAGTDNFLFADEAWRYSDNATSTYNNKVSSGVPTLFHHALAKLAFNVRLSTKTASAKTIWDVDIKDVTIVVGNKGYLNLVNEDNRTTGTKAWKVGTSYGSGAAATSANYGWTAVEGTETIVETTSSATSGVTKEVTLPSTMILKPFDATTSAPATSGDFQALLAERTVMPQTVNGGVATFAMTFTIKLFHANDSHEKVGDAYSTEDVTVSATNLYTLANTIAAWNMNTKVTYNITIDPVGKKILFDPAVADWASANNGENGDQVYPL